MTAPQWYFAVGSERQGPTSREELARKLKSGELSPDTLVWSTGMSSWLPASRSEFAEVKTDVPAALPAAETETYAGFWVRVVAYSVDSVLIGLASAPISFFVGLQLNTHEATPEQVKQVSVVVALGSLAVGVFYNGILQGLLEGTPGKLLFGLRLVREDYLPAGVPRTLGRLFALWVAWLPFGAGILAVGWHPRKQGWHDRIAGTVVVHKKFLERMRVGALTRN